MRITKIYSYWVSFQVGCASFQDSEWEEDALEQILWRARHLPDHRFEVVAHEDLADSADRGAAQLRLSAVEARLGSLLRRGGEYRLHPTDCPECLEGAGEHSRRVDIRMFPSVRSLAVGGGGPTHLSYEEVSSLQSVRLALIVGNVGLEELQDRYRKFDWQRIVGHDSVAEWLQAGRRHPLYTEEP